MIFEGFTDDFTINIFITIINDYTSWLNIFITISMITHWGLENAFAFSNLSEIKDFRCPKRKAFEGPKNSTNF